MKLVLYSLLKKVFRGYVTIARPDWSQNFMEPSHCTEK